MKLRRRILSLLLAVCLAASLALPAAAESVPEGGYTYTDTDGDGTTDTALVYSADGLKSVLENSEYTSMTVSLQNDFTVPVTTQTFTAADAVEITIAVRELVFDGNGHKITADRSVNVGLPVYLFGLAAEVTKAEFKNVSVTVANDIPVCFLTTVTTGKAEVTLGEGVKIFGGFTSTTGTGTSTGVIRIYDNNALIIDGAEITRNVGNIITAAVATAGTSPSVTMRSGTISENVLQFNLVKGYAILLGGTKTNANNSFTMTGGTISGNTGGAAAIYGTRSSGSTSTCKIEVGGTAQIIDNTCTYGGIYSTLATIHIMNGKITGNGPETTTGEETEITPLDIKISSKATLAIAGEAQVGAVELVPGTSVINLTGALQSDIAVRLSSMPTDDIVIATGAEGYPVTQGDADHLKPVSTFLTAALDEESGSILLRHLPITVRLDGSEGETEDALPIFYGYINGAAVTPEVVVTAGDEVINPSNYTLTWADNAPGTDSHAATVTVKPFIANSFASVTASFWIALLPPTSLEDNDAISVTVADSVYAVDGRALSTANVIPVVKDGDTLLVNGTDYTYTVTVAEDGNTGTVTVTGITKYADSVTKTFQIKSQDALPEGSTLVWDEDTLNEAIAAKAGHIVFANDIDVASPVTVGAVKTVAGENGEETTVAEPYTVILDGDGHRLTSSTLSSGMSTTGDINVTTVLTAETGVTLTLDNVTVDGQYGSRANGRGVRTLWVEDGATVTLGATAALENSYAADKGAAIYAEENSAVTIAGTIRGGYAGGQAIYNLGNMIIAEGAVLADLPSINQVIYNAGVLTMSGGEIRPGPYSFSNAGTIQPLAELGNDNGGAIIMNEGAFTMDGGLITGDNGENAATLVFYGAVFNKSTGTFLMNAGEISGFTGYGVISGGSNGATYWPVGAGGVYNQGEFIMEGGAITGNICAPNGSFGAMSSNGVSDFGGGGVINGGVFTMNGGEITNNTAAYNGGGVYVDGYCQGTGNVATFIMNGGVISGNTARNGGGGGVFLSNFGAVFTMNGGKITGNTAVRGADISEPDNNGGPLIGPNNEIVRGAGGAVYVSGCGYIHSSSIGAAYGGDQPAGVLNLLGGEISGNTAEIATGVYISPTGGTDNGSVGAMAGTNTVYEAAVLNLGGAPVVTDTVYLPTVTSEDGAQTSTPVVTITGPLEDEIQINFIRDNYDLGTAVALYAGDVTPNEADGAVFALNNERLTVALRTAGKEVLGEPVTWEQLQICGLLADSEVTLSGADGLTYTGGEQTVTVSVADGETALTEGTDYTVAYENNVSAGTATVTVTGTGNYAGTVKKTFTIAPAGITGAVVALEGESYEYTGEAITPAVTSVTLNGVTLTDTDYTVAYSGNVEVGTATVTVTGTGNYTGTATASFAIAAHVHRYDEGVVTKEPTETEKGEITYTCTECGESYTEELPVIPCPHAVYTDVDPDAWYHEAIDYAITHALFNGVAEDQMAPDGTMTRAMFVTVLYRLANSPEVTGSTPFTDLKGDWYADAVLWAYENHITDGTSDTTFSPDMDITREQMVTFLHRYAQYAGVDVDTGVSADKFNSFADTGSVSGWAVSAMTWATHAGVINGTNVGIEPQATATRAQCAQMFMNFARNILGE